MIPGKQYKFKKTYWFKKMVHDKSHRYTRNNSYCNFKTCKIEGIPYFT